MSRLTRGEQLVLGSSIVLLVLSFIPMWAKYEVGVTSRFSAWSGAFPFYVKLALILAIIAAALTVIRAAGTQLNLPFAAGLVYVVLMGLATLLLLIGALAGPAGSEFESLGGIEVSRGPLLFASVVIAAIGAYGAYLHMQTEGTTTTPTYGGPPTTGPPPPPA